MSDLLVHGAFTATSAARLLRESPGRTTVLWHDGPPGDWVGAAEVLTPDRFLGASEFDLIDGKCGAILEGFHRPPGAGDGAVWEGLPLGEALGGYDQVGLMLPRLVNLVLARRVLAAKTPARLFLGAGPGLWPEVWERLADRRGIAHRRLAPDPPPEVAPEWAPRAALAHPRPRPGWRELPARLGEAARFQLWKHSRRLRERGRDALRRLGGGRKILVLCPRWRGERELGLLWLEELFLSLRFRLCYLDDAPGGETGLPDPAGLRAEFARRWAGLVPRLAGSPLMELDGENAFPHLADLLEDIFVSRLAEVARAAARARRGLDALRPDLVLTRLTWSDFRAPWCLAARARGLPVIAVQREFFNSPRSMFFLPPPRADAVLAVGSQSLAWLAQKGLPPGRVRQIAMRPALDLAARVRAVDRAAAAARLGLGRGPAVLFCDGHYCGSSANDLPLVPWRNLALVKRLAAELPEVKFLVKFHPSSSHREGPAHVQRRVDFLAADRPANLLLAPLGLPLEEALAVAELVVADTSTVGVEAMFLGLPVVFLRTPERGFRILDFEAPPRAAYGVRKPAELATLVRRILADPAAAREELAAGQRRFRELLMEGGAADSLAALKDLLARW